MRRGFRSVCLINLLVVIRGILIAVRETYVVVQNTGKTSLRPELGHVDECEGGVCVCVCVWWG